MEIKKEITHSKICCHTLSYPAEPLFFHWHENFEICRVATKGCTFRIDGRLYKAEVGDIVTIPPHTVHQFIIEHPDTEIDILQFPLSLLIYSSEVTQQLKPHIKYSEFQALGKQEEKASTLLRFMLDENNSKNIGENPFFESLVVSFYLLLQKHFPAKKTVDGKHRDDFFKITEYINTHYREEINLNSVAKALYFSRNKASEIFKKYSGLSINEYINNLRIKSANHLLKEGCTATEAATACGFSNIRTFNNVYKKLMGITPSQYISSNKELRS